MAAEPEVLEPDTETSFALRNPATPVTIDQLAARRQAGKEIIEARVEILETARLRAIRMTHPEDWVLFKSPDDRVTGYLQDSGCERVRPILSISIFDVEEPQKIVAIDGQSFAVIVKGRGQSGITGDALDAVEGIRESTEEFCKSLTGIKQELRVRQAARANLDGKIVRELAGLGSVPLEELERAWKGTDKKTEHCRRGRGFGTQQERHGGENPNAPTDIVPPKCDHCGTTATYKTSARGGFWSCPKWKSHEDRKFLIDAEKWRKDPRSKPPADVQVEPASSASPQAASQQPQPNGPPEPPLLPDADIPIGGNPASRVRR
jgi:hypothetical protein